jgi:N-acetylmuramoyl-L-alanine amidase
LKCFAGKFPTVSRLVCLAVLILAMTGCAHVAHNPMARWVPSPNHNARAAILVVLHATEQASVEQSLHTLRTGNSGGPVSAHYLIGRDGRIYQLVDEALRAWHAGPGRWGTITDVNSASIGIELDNNGTDPFPDVQVDALVRLLADICTRLDVPPSQVIGHADMAPTRKRDPGALFPWARLASEGFGQWPVGGAGPAPPGFDAMQALGVLGYSLDDPEAAIRAFRLHYRGAVGDAAALDAEDARILYALTLSQHRELPVSRPAVQPAAADKRRIDP